MSSEADRSKIKVSGTETDSKKVEGTLLQPNQSQQQSGGKDQRLQSKPQQPQTPAQNKLTIPQKHNRLLRVYDAEDRTPVIDTDEFTISELFMKDPQNFTLWTTVYVTLKDFSQSLWFSNKDHDMKYTIEEGEGWFLINQSGQVVTAGKQVCVPRGNFHMILNNSQTNCVYRFECPGTMDLREYLGIPQK